MKDFIAKLVSAAVYFDKILKADSESLIIKGEKRKQLEKLQTANAKILAKLKSGEFTVAIVGLDNSGKSSLGNALINLMALPSDSERCTFTTTEIRSVEGLENLRQMLGAVEYPDAANVDFNSITLEQFNSYWEGVAANPAQKDLYKAHDGTTAEDIKTILIHTQDRAEVYFYSKEDFLKNFRQMLDAVKYPNADNVGFNSNVANVSFTNITLNNFNMHWNAVAANPAQKDLYKAHNGTTVEDIKTILEHTQTITNFVGESMQTFDRQFINNPNIDNEFKRFITGIVNAATHTRDAHPYAVEKIIIRSTQLADMKDIVLFDVPGFNSPTQMHREQAKEMLREADAIIFVTNVIENPNLEITQRDVLLDTKQDEYSVAVSSKLFVFGNKIDRANTPAIASNNLDTLTREVVTHKVTREGRVIGGSALAYLEGKNLAAGNVATNSLNNLNISSDGVDALRDMIRTYYKNERYEALRSRATKILDDTRELLETLLKENKTTSSLNEQIQDRMISSEIIGNLPKKFKAEAEQITKKYTDDIFAKNPFTEELKKDIEAIYPLVAETPLHYLEEAKHEGGLDPDDVYPTVLIDVYLRQKFSIMFLENIVKRAAKLNTAKHQALQKELVDAFLTSAGIDSPNTYRAELEKSANELFKGMFIEGNESCNFNSLVQRHVMTLIQTLIKYPFASQDRYEKVKATLEELSALAVFFKNPTDKNVFFAKILAHNDSPLQHTSKTSDNSGSADTGNENLLRQFFEVNREIINRGNPVDIEKLPFAQWAKHVNEDNLQSIKDALQDKFNGRHWNEIHKEQKIFQIERFFQNLGTLQENIPAQPTDTPTPKDSDSLENTLRAIHERAKKSHSMYGEEAMVATLNADIKILRDITKQAILKAIGMERTFNAVITTNVSLLCERIQAGRVNEWISRNAEKLQPLRYRNIQKIIAEHKKKEDIVNAIQDLFDDWGKW